MATRVWSYTVSDDGSRLICIATNAVTNESKQYIEWYANAPEIPEEGPDPALSVPGFEVRRHDNLDDAASELFTTLLVTFDS